MDITAEQELAATLAKLANATTIRDRSELAEHAALIRRSIKRDAAAAAASKPIATFGNFEVHPHVDGFALVDSAGRITFTAETIADLAAHYHALPTSRRRAPRSA